MSSWLDTLCARPPWAPERLRTLPGRVRGLLMHRWATHVERRFGVAGVARVRQAAGVPVSALPDEPRATVWYPVWHQLALAHALVDECLGGRRAALPPLLAADLTTGLPFPVKLFLRTVHPRRVLEGLAREFSQAYDLGAMSVVLRGDGLSLSFTGAPVFAEPMWQLLHTVSLASLLEAAGHPADVSLASEAPDAYAVDVRWRDKARGQ